MVRGHDLLSIIHGIRRFWHGERPSDSDLDTATREAMGAADFTEIGVSQFLQFASQMSTQHVEGTSRESVKREREEDATGAVPSYGEI